MDLIFSSSDEMLRLVTQLLDSSALESGKFELNMRPVDLGTLAQLVVHKSQKQAELKQQVIHISQVGEGKSIVMADFDRLQEALDNLVNNAVKYSDKGREIWVKVENETDKVRFEVSDNGPGISDDELPKVFDKFQKLSNQPTGGESSTGLGLSIVKQIVEMHNGMVWVESEVGVGSAFVVQLDAAAGKAGESDFQDRPALSSSRRPSGNADSIESPS
ncbi:MAG: HAMP domain-containing histidine kinase [Acidimicrobiia bacterium]|nr:HAMP domain-containing histidine kinase [Acidimicrobiia bacterium]